MTNISFHKNTAEKENFKHYTCERCNSSAIHGKKKKTEPPPPPQKTPQKTKKTTAHTGMLGDAIASD